MKTKIISSLQAKVFIYSFLIVNLLSQTTLLAQYKFKNNSMDLRPEIKNLGLSVKEQGGRGTCTIFCTTFLIEYMTSKKYNLKNVDYSEEYLNAATNRAINQKSDGSFFSEAIIGYSSYGIVNETDAPYKQNFDSEYLQSNEKTTLALLDKGKQNRFLEGEVIVTNNTNGPGLSNTQFEQLLAFLDSGNPLGIGFAGNDKDGVLFEVEKGKFAYQSAKLGTPETYGHSVPIIGYKVDTKVPGGGYVIFRNSAGSTWGDEGYGYMTFEYVQKYTYDFLIFNHLPPQIKVNAPELEKRFLAKKDILTKQISSIRQNSIFQLPVVDFKRSNEQIKRMRK
jgi:C1A family cysteine protease